MESKTFKLGTLVHWHSQSGGFWQHKIGEIVEVIPPGKRPSKPIQGMGGPRNHESYVVKARVENHRNPAAATRHATYWPLVTKLSVYNPTPDNVHASAELRSGLSTRPGVADEDGVFGDVDED